MNGHAARTVPVTAPRVGPRRAGPLAAHLLCWALVGALGPAAAAGDAGRGAALVASRSQGLCTLCHAVPGQPAHLQGDLGPPLAGVGARLTPAELRQRLIAPEASHPDTIMPAYGRRDGLQQVARAQQGQPLFSPAQVDDVVAYLATLK